MRLTLTYDPMLSRVRLSATELSILDANPYFETDAANWGVIDGSIARSTAQFHEGAASLLLTPNGTGPNPRAQSEATAVVAGTSYRASAWVRCATARTVEVGVAWYTAGSAFLSQNLTAVAVAADTWTRIETVAAPPANAGKATVLVRMTGTPPVSHLLYIDEAKLENAAATTSAVVERSTDGRRWTTVRGGADMKVVDNAVALDDYEFTADAVNTYRVTAYSPTGLPADVVEDFEDATLAVTVTGGWTRASGSAHDGAWSFKSSTIGHGGTSSAVVTVPTGAQKMRFWYRVSSEENYDFFRVLVGAVEQFSVSGEVAWRQSQVFNVTGASSVTLRYTKDSSVTDGSDAVWVDDIVFSGALSQVTNTLTAAVTPVLGGVWLKSVPQPFLNRRVTILDFSDIARPARGGVFDVVGRSFPVAVSDVRGSRRWTLEVLTQTPAEAADFDLVLASGDPLFVHVPAGSPVPGGYVIVGDATQRRTSRYSDRRIFTLPCTEIAAPGPDVVGVTLNWQTVLARYSTWADLLADKATWAELLDSVGSAQDVIVQ